MIVFGRDLVSVIKCENREGCDSLKELHFKVNDILFVLNGKLLFKPTASKAYNELVELGKTVKDLEVPDKAKPKKEEILAQLRDRCQKLRNYIFNYKEEESDVPAMQKAVNFWMHQFIEAKEKNEIYNPIKLISLLGLQKELWDGGIIRWRDQVKVDNFKKANKELTDIAVRLFTIKDESYD